MAEARKKGAPPETTQQEMKEIADLPEWQMQIRRARNAAVPLIGINTPDPATTRQAVAVAAFKGEELPIVHWDIIQGLQAVNDAGVDALMVMILSQQKREEIRAKPREVRQREVAQAGALLANLPEVLGMLTLLPKYGIAFVANAHRYIEEPAVVQAIWNLRDRFKSDRRTLVLMAPDLRLPAELAQDVFTIDEPLPTEQELEVICRKVMEYATIPADPFLVARVVDATTGLSSFSTEQVIAMSIRSRRGAAAPEIDVEAVWERKRRVVEQTRGLSVWRGDEGYSDVGGNANIKEFLTRYFAGPYAPRALVFEDEMEKMFGGLAGDTSGVTQELLGKKLSYMQDMECTGLIFVGPAGSGKSMMAKAAGNMAKVPTICMNLSDMKGSLVGQSTENLSAALRVITAVAGGRGRAMFIGTCNNMAVLPPELIGRYKLGVFFFDLPDEEEKEIIWNIWLKKMGLDPQQPRPDDAGWAGRDIQKCCENARNLKTTVVESAKYVVSVTQSSGEKIARLRSEANGRYISASRPGVYQWITEDSPIMATASGRLLT